MNCGEDIFVCAFVDYDCGGAFYCPCDGADDDCDGHESDDHENDRRNIRMSQSRTNAMPRETMHGLSCH